MRAEIYEDIPAIYFPYCNFRRAHQTIGDTPAMEANIFDHVWCIQEVVGLLDRKSILDGLMQTA
jgi:hypothetical protein